MHTNGLIIPLMVMVICNYIIKYIKYIAFVKFKLKFCPQNPKIVKQEFTVVLTTKNNLTFWLGLLTYLFGQMGDTLAVAHLLVW